MLTIEKVKQFLKDRADGIDVTSSLELNSIAKNDVWDTLEAALLVVEAAKKVVRMGYRQSRENAPLEYALWESLKPFWPQPTKPKETL